MCYSDELFLDNPVQNRVQAAVLQRAQARVQDEALSVRRADSADLPDRQPADILGLSLRRWRLLWRRRMRRWTRPRHVRRLQTAKCPNVHKDDSAMRDSHGESLPASSHSGE